VLVKAGNVPIVADEWFQIEPDYATPDKIAQDLKFFQERPPYKPSDPEFSAAVLSYVMVNEGRVVFDGATGGISLADEDEDQDE
jgi:hypothetical protein